ncbi:hypothetical protein BT96DRAFT_1019362 [Gymnopus androsaceus JB14]|uniref:Uncharacterized protein n=1 Tax=Gymnopus androsaceus JB14 TaxID=1447944 RepID=A0A6A4HNM7_9AGAR|nr:hypothetical protein BT96DRAFT_1019362 [Gymnopus androsaceus JB14]
MDTKNVADQMIIADMLDFCDGQSNQSFEYYDLTYVWRQRFCVPTIGFTTEKHRRRDFSNGVLVYLGVIGRNDSYPYPNNPFQSARGRPRSYEYGDVVSPSLTTTPTGSLSRPAFPNVITAQAARTPASSLGSQSSNNSKEDSKLLRSPIKSHVSAPSPSVMPSSAGPPPSTRSSSSLSYECSLSTTKPEIITVVGWLSPSTVSANPDKRDEIGRDQHRVGPSFPRTNSSLGLASPKTSAAVGLEEQAPGNVPEILSPHSPSPCLLSPATGNVSTLRLTVIDAESGVLSGEVIPSLQSAVSQLPKPSEPTLPQVTALSNTSEPASSSPHLEKLRLKGILNPLRSVVSLTLIKGDKELYRHAGCTKWKDFADKAEGLGLIKLGGEGGKAWITVHPDLRGRIQLKS